MPRTLRMTAYGALVLVLAGCGWGRDRFRQPARATRLMIPELIKLARSGEWEKTAK